MRKATTPVILAVVLILAFAVGVNAQAVATNFTWVVTKLLTVTDVATFTSSVSVAGASNLAGNTSVGGTLSVTGNTALATGLNIVPQTAISVTNGGIITPTGAVQLLTAAGNVTATLATGQAGQMLTVINTANVTMLIQDTTGQIFSGDASLGQWDTADFVWYGTSWIQTGESNN